MVHALDPLERSSQGDNQRENGENRPRNQSQDKMLSQTAGKYSGLGRICKFFFLKIRITGWAVAVSCLFYLP